MAIRKYIIKNTHLECVVKIVNDVETAAQATIALATDILKSNESLTGAPLDVSIRNIEWSLHPTTGLATLTRNSKVTHRLYNTHSFENPISSDHEESASDIVVDMTGGTMVLHLIKKSGYAGVPTEPQFQG